MKCRVLRTVIFTVLTGFFLPAFAQKNYYVVVGAFSTNDGVKDFTTHLPSMNADTAYAMNNQENVVQLYVLHTSSKEVAAAKALQLQSNLEDQNGSGSISENYESITISNGVEGKNVTVRNSSDVLALKEVTHDEASSSRSSSTLNATVPPASSKAMGKLFKFTISDPNGRAVNGKVHYIDFERQRDIATYTASTYIDILNPGKDKEMALVCGVFGYKQVEKYFTYNQLAAIEGAYRDQNGAWVIPYDLERLEKDDVSVMYNVVFHKDAVVMLPQAKTDLDELVTMMKENPKFEITIHGHCNGKNDRKIIALSTSDGYFDIAGTEQIFGSAKKLSSLRADAVQAYLLKNGIEDKRIKTFAWGGSLMLAHAESTHAKLNDRIEIEIRKD